MTVTNCSTITEQISITRFGPQHRYREVRFNKDRKVPIFSQLPSQEKDAIDQQDGARLNALLTGADWPIRESRIPRDE